MVCLVTGGAGFIGSHLVDRLIADGHQVIVVDDFSSGKEVNLSQHQDNLALKIYRRSIVDDLSDIFKIEKIDCLFHLAALPRVQFSIDYPVETHRTNVDGTFNLLGNCVKHKVKRFIFSSSSSVYGDQERLPLEETMIPNPMSPYALHKLIGEQYCRVFYRVYGLETISLRYFNVYGPRQSADGGYANLIPRSIAKVVNGEPPQFTNDGKQTRDFTYVSDVVEANVKAMMTKNNDCIGESFNIGAANNISVMEVLEALISISGKKFQPVFWENRLEPKDTLADISKAKSFLGWEPRVDFKQGIKEEWNYFANLHEK